MIEYLIEHQEMEYPREIIHKGKKITAIDNGKIVGNTGFVEWNCGLYWDRKSKMGLFKLVGCNFSISVLDRKRGIGTGLMEELFTELDKEHYDTLLIPDVIKSSKEFYDKIFKSFLQKKIISSVDSNIRYPDIPDWIYTIHLKN